MKQKQIHITYDSDSEYWKILKAGNTRATTTAEKKQQAIIKAKKISKKQKAELFIHNKDGKISNRISYGNDPYPPKG